MKYNNYGDDMHLYVHDQLCLNRHHMEELQGKHSKIKPSHFSCVWTYYLE